MADANDVSFNLIPDEERPQYNSNWDRTLKGTFRATERDTQGWSDLGATGLKARENGRSDAGNEADGSGIGSTRSQSRENRRGVTPENGPIGTDDDHNHGWLSLGPTRVQPRGAGAESKELDKLRASRRQPDLQKSNRPDDLRASRQAGDGRASRKDNLQETKQAASRPSSDSETSGPSVDNNSHWRPDIGASWNNVASSGRGLRRTDISPMKQTVLSTVTERTKDAVVRITRDSALPARDPVNPSWRTMIVEGDNLSDWKNMFNKITPRWRWRITRSRKTYDDDTFDDASSSSGTSGRDVMTTSRVSQHKNQHYGRAVQADNYVIEAGKQLEFNSSVHDEATTAILTKHRDNTDRKPSSLSESPELLRSYSDSDVDSDSDEDTDSDPDSDSASDANVKEMYPRKGKGFVLLINFTTDRHGWKKDQEDLKKFFKKLKFEVHENIDPTPSQLIEFVKDNKKRVTHKYKCFVCVVMGHGDKIGIVNNTEEKTQNEVHAATYEYIRTIFNNKYMPDFAGRPKIILINSCRGLSWQTMIPKQRVESDGPVPTTSVGEDADLFIFHSSVDGYQSARDTKTGTYFIQLCVQVFQDKYSTTNITDMATIINGKLQDKFPKQTSEFISTMRFPFFWA